MPPKQRSAGAFIRQESLYGDILLDEDIEEPLMPPTEAEEALELVGTDISAASASAQTAAAEPPLHHVPWPALRRSSVSIRKVSPVVGFDPNEVSTSSNSEKIKLKMKKNQKNLAISLYYSMFRLIDILLLLMRANITYIHSLR
jgi:hypothetical protein